MMCLCGFNGLGGVSNGGENGGIEVAKKGPKLMLPQKARPPATAAPGEDNVNLETGATFSENAPLMV